jgi:flagellar biosynthesis protein FlhG
MNEIDTFAGEFPPSTPALLLPPRGARCFIAVGGGRGGVGKSVLSVNLATYLAQLGRSVVLVDADIGGANLHTVLGLDGPPIPSREQIESGTPHAVPTSVPGLRVMGAMFDPTAMSSVRPGRRSQWASTLKKLDCDFVVVDLGSGSAPATLDLFAMADVCICVTMPEPPAVEATYRFLRSLYLRKLRRSLMKERFKLRLVERAMMDLSPLPTPIEVIGALARQEIGLAKLATAELRRLAPRLVVNSTREKADTELGPTMQAMADRYLGIELDYIGYIEHDDAVWLTVRRRRPLLIDSPTAKSARLIERIARRVVALTAAPPSRISTPPPPPTDRRMTLYDVLRIQRGASDEEVRRASRKQKELYVEGSLPLLSILDAEGIRAEQARIEEAHDTLLDPIKRRAYDLSTFADANEAPAPKPLRTTLTEEQLLAQAELAREIHSTTEFTGAFLRRVRESLGIDITDIASRTKIAKAHLVAIEEESFADLPALVYARGFVREFAKSLKLDPAQVDRSYLRRMREGLVAMGKPVE